MATAARTDRHVFELPGRTHLDRLLSEGKVRELEELCKVITRRAGATLFRQGEPADTLFILVEGSVELRARPPGRRVYRTVEVITSPCTLGDEALFLEGSYLAGARTLESVRVLALTRPAFERVALTDPEIATAILRSSGACLIQTIRRSAILTQAPADVGLRLLLQELGSQQKQNGQAAALRVTHAQLAGVLHLSRETVSRMLRQLADEGTVELGRGVIRVRLD
jgi:CRP/FNR family cyclic AMP-dependent transcriptional regulator